MKSILQSIKPQYCELIASGKKTIEVRKTKPKLDVPFKVYIYCTKSSKKHQTICGCMVLNSDELFRLPNGKIKYGDSIEMMLYDDYTKDNFLNGKVIGEYVCDEIEPKYCANGIATYYENEQGTCLSDAELQMYADGVKPLYFWHISDLVIYDKPKELSEFTILCKEYDKDNPDCECCDYQSATCDCDTPPQFDCKCNGLKPLTRPPQSWCYVEEA